MAREIRCFNCNRFLAKAENPTKLEIKCQCGTVNHIHIEKGDKKNIVNPVAYGDRLNVYKK